MSPVPQLLQLLGRCDLRQRNVREFVGEEIRRALLLLDAHHHAHAVALLEAAMRVLGVLGVLPPVRDRELDATLRRLVALAAAVAEHGSVAQAQPAEPFPAPPRSDPGSPPPLAPATPIASEYAELEGAVEDSVGSILVRMGEVAPEEVRRARDGGPAGERLGERLVRSGSVDGEAVGKALRLQKGLVLETAREVKEGRIVDEWCLGEILVRLTWIDRPTLEEGLRVQRAAGIRLGEALVQMGAVTWAQVQDAIRIQERERSRRREQGESLRLDE